MRTRSSRSSSSASPRSVEARSHHAPVVAVAGADRPLALPGRARRRDDLGGRPPRQRTAAAGCALVRGVELPDRAGLRTKRARIGPLVSPMTYRNPGVLARQALTVAEISGGRLELGIGSGASAYDHEATQVPEWPPKERAAAFVT